MKFHCSFVLLGFLSLAVSQTAFAGYSRHDRDNIISMLENEAWRQGVPVSLVVAVARVESDFNPRARSSAGARGVMQIMPRTAEDELGVARRHLYNPHVNIEAGVRFLKQLLNRYDGRVDIALSHYNGGSGVFHHGRLRVIPATRGYVRKVLALQGRYRHYYASHDWPVGRSVRVVHTDLDDFGPNGSLTVLANQKVFDNPVITHRKLWITRVRVQDARRQLLADELQQLAVHNVSRPGGPSGNGHYRW